MNKKELRKGYDGISLNFILLTVVLYILVIMETVQGETGLLALIILTAVAVIMNLIVKIRLYDQLKQEVKKHGRKKT